MDKKRIRELIVIAVIFAVYNMLVFVMPFKRTDIFAISYVFALISILAFAACYFIAFGKPTTLKSKFLSFPIFKIGRIYLTVQLSLSTLFMILTSFIPIYRWIVIVPCVIILSIAIVKVVLIDVARGKMEDIAVKQEINTAFIRTLHVDLETLVSRVSTEPLKSLLSKLSESVRFSDPVSNEKLSEIELKMTEVFSEVKVDIQAGRHDVETQIDELNHLLVERNKLCRISKPM